MDLKWTPMSSRPAMLYRVWNPKQHTQLRSAGLVATDPKLAFGHATQLSQFITSIEEHRFGKPKPSPYISCFSDLSEAENWCLAGEDVFREPWYVLEINMAHEVFRTIPTWRVQDIQDKTGKLIGGIRNSEWLVAWYIPRQAINRIFKSSTQIRLERGMQVVRYVQPPNFSRRDARQPRGGFSNRSAGLRCGCRSEKICIHFQWPGKKEEDNSEVMGPVEAVGEIQTAVGIQRTSFGNVAGMPREGVQIPDGQPVRGVDRDSEDTDVAIWDPAAT